MNQYLLLTGVVIALCVLVNRYIEKLPVPSLLVFIALGMCFGENGLFRIPFDNYQAAEILCSVCLIFIMYYGGFGANVKQARSVAAQSVLLSTVGVVLTALLVGAFAHYALGLSWLEGMLTGSVIASTDAASVFNMLRSQQLNLKYNTASLLEIESGSNDPMSYMLTVVFTTLIAGQQISVPWMLAKQIVLGLLFGVLIGKATVWLLNRFHFNMAEGETIFVLASALLAYALPNALGGNGYLSVYICGIWMGNSSIPKKRNQVRFFDVLTGVAQMMIFFLLGLLVTPAKLPSVALPALLIMLFMTFVARPVATTAILAPFRAPARQIALVSWAGLRGVASIVFAIYAVLQQIPMRYDLFNLVFCIVLLSIALQGSLLPWMSRMLNMIDSSADVRKTFNDYQEESPLSFIKLQVEAGHPWEGQALQELPLPRGLLVSAILRQKQVIAPNGKTRLQSGDLLVIAGNEFENRRNLTMEEIVLEKGHKWCGRTLGSLEMPKGSLVVLVQRPGEAIIPGGDTLLQPGDSLVMARF